MLYWHNFYSNIYHHRPLPPQIDISTLRTAKATSELCTVFRTVKIALNCFLTSLFKMQFDITDIHVNSSKDAIQSYRCKTCEISFIRSMLPDKKYFVLEARKDKLGIIYRILNKFKEKHMTTKHLKIQSISFLV